MTSLIKRIGQTNFNVKKTAFLMLVILNINWIHSQTTLDTQVKDPSWFQETRDIRYQELNELMKYGEYYNVSKEQDGVKEKQIEIQSKTIDSLVKIIGEYKNDLIPKYDKELFLLRTKLESYEAISAIREEKWELKYKALKSKRLGIGAYVGYGATTEGLSPSIGFALNYTFIRL